MKKVKYENNFLLCTEIIFQIFWILIANNYYFPIFICIKYTYTYNVYAYVSLLWATRMCLFLNEMYLYKGTLSVNIKAQRKAIYKSKLVWFWRSTEPPIHSCRTWLSQLCRRHSIWIKPLIANFCEHIYTRSAHRLTQVHLWLHPFVKRTIYTNAVRAYRRTLTFAITIWWKGIALKRVQFSPTCLAF